MSIPIATRLRVMTHRVVTASVWNSTRASWNVTKLCRVPCLYKMPVTPEMEGETIEVVSLTPGVVIAPGAQFVAPGTTELLWQILGATPGTTVKLLVNNVEVIASDPDGYALCCSTVIEIEIPEEFDCLDKSPDLSLEKKADMSVCDPEGPCDFTITVKNVGDAPYTGPVVIDEWQIGDIADLLSWGPAGWNCGPNGGQYECTYLAANLPVGATLDLNISFKPGAAWPEGHIRNCARLNWGLGNPVIGDPANDKDCAEICIKGKDPLCTPVDKPDPNLEIEKLPDQSTCLAGEPCGFKIRVTNTSAVDYLGPVVVKDQVTVGLVANATFEPAAEWNCLEQNPTTFQCTHTTMGLGAGESRELKVSITTPADYTAGTIENCGTLLWEPGAGDANPADDGPSCARVQIIPKEPGKPEYEVDKACKTAPGTGESMCRISIRNVGDAVGPDVTIADVAKMLGTDLGVTLQSVTPDGPDWTCSALPANNLTCDLPGNAIVPGGPARYFEVWISPNVRGRFENCAYVTHFNGNPILIKPDSQLRACDVGGREVSTPPVPPVRPPLVCPPGTVKRGDRCIRLPQCGPGERLVNGQCVNICRPGTVFNRQTGRCEPVVRPCPDGTVRRNGQCVPIVVCQPGERLVRGQCVPVCRQGTRYNPRTRQCDPIVVCKPGQRFVNGQCVNICRQGTRYNPRTRQCDPIVVCKPGQRLVRGKCVNICRQGTRYNPRTRQCDPIVVCKPGQRLVRGKCVNICRQGTRYDPRTRKCVSVRPPVQCKVGQRLVRGKCVNICRQGTRYNPRTRQCVSVRPPVQCKAGQRLVRGKCVNICRQGTRYNPRTRKCVSVRPPVQCKRGERLVRGKCVPVVRACPRGTVRKGNRCVKVIVPQTRTPQTRVPLRIAPQTRTPTLQ